MKISIRYQILGVLSALLLFTVAAYLLLASQLLADDKLAYIYDLERSVTATVSQEVHASLSSLVDKLDFFAAEEGRGEGQRAAEALLSTDRDLLSLEIWERRPTGFELAFRHVDPRHLAEANLSESDLTESRRLTPVPFDVLAGEGPVLQNASLPPDIALLSLAAPVAGGRRMVVATLRPSRLLHIFGRSDAYRVYLVDGKGVIVIHPDASRMIRHQDALSAPIVNQATRGARARVQEFPSPVGPVIAASTPVGNDLLDGVRDLPASGLARLSVVAEVPRDEALAASRRLVRRSVLFGLGILFLGLIASIYLARRLTAPLRSLEEATQAVGRGDFSRGVAVTERNEIGRLATAFNHMGQELADREARLSEAHTHLVEAEKLSVLGELSASVAHEVRNPLAGIVGYAQLGLTMPTLEQTREYLQLIERHAWRASELLETLLDFSRQDRVELGAVDACAITADTVRLVQHQLHAKRIQLETNLGSGLPPIAGDGKQLQQVLLNLIMNAVQAMEGQSERRLRISVAAESEAVTISVRDTGAGMSPEVKAKVFTPFFTTKPRGKGTGLGLSVSQRIVRQHQGEIYFESDPGKGSTFTIRIPIVAASAQVGAA